MQKLATGEQISLSLRVLNTPFGTNNAPVALKSSTLSADESDHNAAEVQSQRNDTSRQQRLMAREAPGPGKRLATVSSRHSFVNSAKSGQSPSTTRCKRGKKDVRLPGSWGTARHSALPAQSAKNNKEAYAEWKEAPMRAMEPVAAAFTSRRLQEEETKDDSKKVAVLNWPFNRANSAIGNGRPLSHTKSNSRSNN